MEKKGLSAAVRLALMSSSLVLSACGGGGGSKESPPPVVEVPPIPSPSVPSVPSIFAPETLPVPGVGAPLAVKNSAAYVHLTRTNVNQAHAQGVKGAGQKIGLVDTDVNVFHPTLQGKVAATANWVSGNTPTTLTGPDKHGTVVAEILVGQGLGAFQGGVAPDAQLYAAGASTLIDGNIRFGSSAMEKSTEWLLREKVSVINYSLNGDPITNLESESRNWSNFTLVAQKAVNANTVLVFANGNKSGSQPGVMAALPLTTPSLERGWLSVSSYDPLTQGLAGHSNACGVAQNWCLVAPGSVFVYNPNDNLQISAPSSTYEQWTGTSFATPQVSAAVALVQQQFPWMSNNQVRHTLLGTANDLGAEGVDEVFGYGLLNTGAAVNGMRWLNWGQEQLNVSSGHFVFANNMHGSGGLHKNGEGTLQLTGDNTYTGPTVINQGVLHLSGRSRSTTTVNPSATFVLSGFLNADLRNNGAVKFMGGALNSYTQSSTATWQAVLGAPVVIAGPATVDGALRIVGKVSPEYITQSRENLATASVVAGQFSSVQVDAGLLLNATVQMSPTQIDVDLSRVNAATLAVFQSSPLAQELGAQLDNAFHVADHLTTLSNPTAAQHDFVAKLATAQSQTDPDNLYAMSQNYSAQPTIALFNTLALVQHAQNGLMNDRLPSVLGDRAGMYGAFASDEWSHAPSGWGRTTLSASTTTAGVDWSNGASVLGVNWRYSEGRLRGNANPSKLRSNTLSVYASHQLGNWEGGVQLSAGEGRWTNSNTTDRVRHNTTSLQVGRPFATTHGRITPALSWCSSHHRFQADNTGEMGFLSPKLSLKSWGADIGFTSTDHSTHYGWNWNWGGSTGWEKINQHQGQWAAYYPVDPTMVFVHNYAPLDDRQWKLGAHFSAQKDRYRVFARWDARYGATLNSHGWQVGARVDF